MTMTLYQKLQQARSEEDVKDAYIKALGLKGYSKNLIDIQTKEIWFEAKDNSKTSTYAMFTQLMHYVQQALNKGEYVPPFLCVIDTQKAAIMKSSDVIPFLEKKTIKWGKSASSYTPEALDAISAHIGTYFVSFKIETHEQEFISTIKNAILQGDIIRTQITPDNLKQVFDKILLINIIFSGYAGDKFHNWNFIKAILILFVNPSIINAFQTRMINYFQRFITPVLYMSVSNVLFNGIAYPYKRTFD